MNKLRGATGSATNMHVNLFICRDERACVSLAKSKFCAGAEMHLTLETNASMAMEMKVSSVREYTPYIHVSIVSSVLLIGYCNCNVLLIGTACNCI